MHHDERIARGMQLIPAAGEIMPDSAKGVVSDLYEDIRNTLRVPLVNFLFRVLASQPQRLESCWNAVKPMMTTIELERQADALRAAAVLPDEDRLDAIAQLADGQLRDFTRTIQYVLPKLLLIAAALGRGLGHTAARWAPPTQSFEIPTGPAPGTQKMELVSVEEAPAHVREILTEVKELHRHPGVASYYRAVANHPDFLRACWSELRPRIGEPRYASARSQLIARADAAIEHAGMQPDALAKLSPQAASEVLAMTEVFRLRLIPDLLLDVTLIRTWVEGRSAASRSPFPVD